MTEGQHIHVPVPRGLPPQAVQKYVGNCRNRLPAVHEAIEQQNFEFLRVSGHGMKGSGSPYGFPEITDIGALMEQAATARDIDQLRQLGATLEAYLSAIELPA